VVNPRAVEDAALGATCAGCGGRIHGLNAAAWGLTAPAAPSK